MRLKKNSIKNSYIFLISYFILWIILFEFFLPANNILPKPSVVLLSFAALWNYYKLPMNFLSTISAVYFSILCAYFLTWLLRGQIVKKTHYVTDFLLSLHWFSVYIPGVVFGIFFIYWFPTSEYIEYIFAFLIAFFSLVIKLREESVNVKREFIDSTLSLGISEKEIAKTVIWEYLQPAVLKYSVVIHFNIWSVLIAFEFIKGGYGLGNVYRIALNYKDLSAIFTVSIIIGLVIFLVNILIHYVKRKFHHWSFV